MDYGRFAAGWQQLNGSDWKQFYVEEDYRF